MNRSSSLLLVVTVSCAFLGACAPAAGLRLSPDRAEFPLGNSVVVDGRFDPMEWQHARSTSVRLSDGRHVKVHFQRDARNFYFAFEGLDRRDLPPVRPEILMDVWADGGRSWREDDWWFAIGAEDCQSRGSIGGDDCARERTGWVANNFPLTVGQVVEVAIEFRVVGASENYEGRMGLGLRFVQVPLGGDYSESDEVGIWPPGANSDWPESWAELSLVH